MTVNLPRILDEKMEMSGTIFPDTVSITRNLHDLSTARVVLPPGEPVIKARSFIKLFDRYGSAGVFRVSKVRTAYGKSVEMNLKHSLCVLEDDTVKVSDGKTSGTAEQIFRTLFSSPGVTQSQKYWRLGFFAETPVIEFEYSNPNLLDAVWDVLKKTPGYALNFDQSVFPWVLNLVKLNDSVSCEGRFGRNLESCSVDVDDTAFCSRVYLDDREGYTDSPSVDEWGVSSQVLTVPEGADETALMEYVQSYLREYGEPRVTITLEAADMSASTGEELDAFLLGKVCRACLPDYGATVSERIITVTTPDVYGDPDTVIVSMANRSETVSGYLEKLRKSARQLSDQSKVTNRRVGGVGSSLNQTNIELTRTKEELTDTRYRLSKAGLIINGDAENVKVFAYQETTDRLEGRVDTAESELIVQAGLISTKVSENGVISAINQTAEIILIQANRIDLSGYVTMSEFEAEIANVDKIFAGTAILAGLGISGTLLATNVDVSSNLRIYGYDASWNEITLYKGGSISVSQSTSRSVLDANGKTIGYVTVPVGWSFTPSSNGTYTFLTGE